MIDVQVPSALASYACERTLVCCRPPWRVWLTEEETASLGPAHTERLGYGRNLLTQTGDQCSLLDAGPPGACSLQRARGHDALPAQCQAFPRSVVATPQGVEVAFLIDCPTVARLVVEAEAPFELGPARLAVRPLRTIDDVGQMLTFREIQAQREAWWARLAQAQDATALLKVAAEMAEAPAGPVPELALVMLARLPGGARFEPHRAALLAALDDAEWVPPERVAPFAYAAAMGVQFAGVHDGRPMAAGIRAAGRLLVHMLRLDAAIRLVCGVEATGSALTAATHASRLERFTQVEFLG